MAIQPLNIVSNLRAVKGERQSPVVVQGDTLRDLSVSIMDGTNLLTNAELIQFSTIAITYTPSYGQSVMHIGQVVGDSILFPIGTLEANVVGLVKASIQLYQADGRVSTLSFPLEVLRDEAGFFYAPNAYEQTLIQSVLIDGPAIINSALTAAIEADEARDAAYLAEGIALSAAEVADLAALNADAKAVFAQTQGTFAQTQGAFAQGAGNYVKGQVDRAVEQGNVAEAKGSIADGQGDTAQAQGEDAAAKAALAVTKTAETEAVRVATEAERLATEAKRIQTEAVRLATEAERLATAVVRNATSAVKDATETVRLNTEAVRIATETERLNTASERLATAAERLATSAVKSATDAARTDYLAVRQSVIEERQLSEANRTNLTGRMTTVEGVAATAKTTADLAKARADLIIGQAGTSNTEIVDSRLGADLVARATSGELIREIHAALIETARQTTTLTNGVSVVSGGVDALAETEVEGRTLISLSNSNMEANKQYVLANKNTKVIVDGIAQSGVAKFTKGTTTVSTANFVGKVTGSTVANPHVAKGTTAPTFKIPSDTITEFTQGHITNLQSLNGVTTNFNAVGYTNGHIAQHLFSFDVIAEIERKLGIIPKSTVAEKVQWVKDNVESLVASWHGFGSSVGGNKATFTAYRVSTSVWHTGSTHSNSGVTKIQFTPGISFVDYIDANGFVHYLAYADASDGITPSSISTDFIDLVVTLKATAQLNTRPTIIRVENFEGKQSGSVVENASVGKYKGSATLNAPTGFTVENSQLHYDRVKTLDGSPFVVAQSVNGDISQQLFSFNLIEAIERNVGKIPRTSVADKVQWLKDNITNFIANWHGFGSSVGGNKATLVFWRASDSQWYSPVTHANAIVSKLTRSITASSSLSIDSNGFVHFLAYADASDGVTASTINTDFIDLEIEIKPTADFTRPKVALYEVTADSYAKILVDWSADEVINRYPSVEGVQHLQGIGVIAEGENLLPPFTEWNLHANAKVISPYELELVGTGANQLTDVIVSALPNKDYYFKLNNNGNGNGIMNVYELDSVGGTVLITTDTHVGKKITTNGNTKQFRVRIGSNVVGTYKLTEPMLTLGITAKPFVPRNPSYLYADVKLGAIGTVADRLYEQDGAKFVRKVIEKDFVLDGSLTWGILSSHVGYKKVHIANPIGIQIGSKAEIISNFGKRLMFSEGNATPNQDMYFPHGNGYFYLTISNVDTGFGEAFSPTSAEIKAYFYGYKMNNGTFGTNYEATGTKTWIPISDTTNARAVTVVPTSPSPTQLDGTIQPYKLSYVLATPQIVNVTDKVEGQLKVNGLTQVEALSGIVRREKTVPVLSSGFYYINTSSAYLANNTLKNKTEKILKVYRNGLEDNRWAIQGGSAPYGKQRALIAQADFDSTAEYTVTYIALDKPLLTANPTNIKLLYANNMRSSLEDTVGRVENNTTQLSVHEKAIIDLYVRVKALEVKV